MPPPSLTQTPNRSQASVVAALRAEIAALDDQLNGRPVSTPMFTPGAADVR